MAAERGEQRRISMLAIVHPGEGNPQTGLLTWSGKSQMKKIGWQIQENVGLELPYRWVLASSDPIVMESGLVLAGEFSCPMTTHPELGLDDEHPMNLEKAYKVIGEAGTRANLVMVVPHPAYTRDLPRLVGKIEHIKVHQFNGQGVILDLSNKRSRSLRWR